MRSSDPIEQLRDAFKEIDADGSGSIDRSELKEMMMSMMSNDYTEEEIDVMIDKADLDGDGEIDFEGQRTQQSVQNIVQVPRTDVPQF
jgi:calmodulin